MKSFITMRFEIDISEPETAERFAQWATSDPAGFLLARPTLAERLPFEVIVTPWSGEQIKMQGETKRTTCEHRKYTNGFCAEMTCYNYVNKRPFSDV